MSSADYRALEEVEEANYDTPTSASDEDDSDAAMLERGDADEKNRNYGSFHRVKVKKRTGHRVGGVNSPSLMTDSPTLNPRRSDYVSVLMQRARRYFRGDGFLLTLALIMLVLSRSVDQTLYYRMARKYNNYVWYLATIVLPVAYLCIGWPVVWYKLMFTDHITPKMRKFPQYKYAIMGMFDSLYNLTSTWPVPYIEGSLVNVLSNVVLPFTMIGSLIFLKTRYKKEHYLGATLVAYGVMVRLMPQLFLGQGADGSTKSQNAGLWITVLVLSNIPSAASNVYKEWGLKDTEADVWYMNAWIGVYQFIFGMITIPTVAIPFPPPAPIITFSDMPSYMRHAHECFFGQDTEVGDDCKGMFLVFLVFIVFNVTYNQLMLYIFKRGSSVLFTIASAMRLPCVDLLLLSGFIAGPAKVDNLNAYDWYALFILMIGIIVYYSEKEVHLRTFGDDEDKPIQDGDYVERDTMLASPHGGGGHLDLPAPEP